MGKEELKSSIQQKEAALTGIDFETRKEEVEGEKGVVDENKVHEAISAIEKRIAGSSLSDRFKQKLTEKLSESTNHWQKKVDAFRTNQAEKYKEKFKVLFDQVLDAFAKFDERPEVKEIFEVVEPFFENARQIKAVINLDTYKRRSSDWEKLNKRLALIGIDSEKIRGIQKILHVKVDGKLGPETINVLNGEIYEQDHEVKWSDEETRHKTETPEQFGERAGEAMEILDSEGWKSLEKETERQFADLKKRHEGTKTLDDIKRFEREEARIIMTANQSKQRYIEEFRARKEAEVRAASAGRAEAVESTDNATGAKAAPGAEVVGPVEVATTAEPAPVVAQAQKPSESQEEKEAIEAAFKRVEEMFVGWGIPVAIQSYISAYKAFSKEKRIPLGQIEGHFHKITVAAQGSKGNPDQVIRNNQKEIIKALGQFVNGVGGEGIRTVDHVIAQILDDHKFAETMPEYTELERGVVEKEHALKQSAEFFMRNVMGNGKSRPGHEDDRENYRVAYMGLIDSLRPLVVIREKFPDRFRERQDSVTVANFVPAPDEHGKVKLVEAQIPMPDTIKQYEELRGRFEAAFLTERRLYYIATGDPKYKAAFDESQQRMTDQLRGETSAALDEAGEEVSSVIDSIVTEFDQLQRLQAADAMAAYHGSVRFHKKLLALKNKNPSGTKIDFTKLAKLPNVQTTFFRIVDTYDEQTTYLTVQAISQNRDVARYQELYQDFMNQTRLFLRQVNSIYDNLKKTGEEPTELTMQEMHRWVGEIRNHPFFQNSNRSPGSRFADLKYMDFKPGSDYAKHHNLALMGVKEMVYGRNTGYEGDHIGASDYLNMVNTLCSQMLQMQGEAATFKTFVKQTGKEVAVLTAAVAGAVAMGALVAATGGLAGAGIAVVAGNLAIGAVCTGLGAAIGSQYSRAIIEGTSDHITTTAMLKAWGVGSAFSFAAGAGGTVLGTTLGRAGAAMARGSGALSQRAADAARKMGEKMMQSAKVPGATAEKGLKTQLSHLFKEFAQETREEVVEDSLQKIGEGIAPEHPWLGFTLSIIPHTSRTARATFMKSNWSFSPAAGVTAQITDGGMHMKYNDVSQVRAFLEQKGAPAEALAQLDATGVVDVQAEGMRIRIEPTSEPVDARLLLAASLSSRARELEGVKFNEDTGQYECADVAAGESFVNFFQSEGYIILEQNADGSVVLERAGETVRLAAAPTVKVEADVEEKVETEPGRFEIWSKQIVEWMDARIAEISDLQLRQRVSSLVADMRQAGSDMTDTVWRRVSEGWLRVGAELRTANEALWKRVDEGMQKLRVMRETFRKRRARTDIKVEAEAANISQNTVEARKRRMNPEGKEYAEVMRETDVLSIPDIHGDVEALKNSMRTLGLIDAKGNWIGGNKVVQFSGDYIDRGTSNLATLDFIAEISRQAKAAGGRIDMLMGNHEAFMLGALLGESDSNSLFSRYGTELRQEVALKYGIDADDYAGITAKLREECFKPGGRYYELIHSWKPVSQVDDVLYVHAGVSPKWARMIRDLGVDGVNARWQQALADAERGDYTLFNEFNEIGKSRYGDAEYGGLFWIDFDGEIENMPESDIKIVAESLKGRGINAVIVGHSKVENPRLAGAFEKYGLKIVASDVGMSSGYRGEGNSGKGGVRIDTRGNIVAESNEASHKLHEVQEEAEVVPVQSVEHLRQRIMFMERKGTVELNAIFEGDGRGAESYRAELASLLKDIDAVPGIENDADLTQTRNDLLLQLRTVDTLIEQRQRTDALIDELWDSRIDSDVKQGKVGNCYLIAALKALKGNPRLMREVIGKTITKVGPGRWKVKFSGDFEVGEIEITEEGLRDWNQKHSSFKGAKGDMILEAAYASLRARSKHGREGYTRITDDKGNYPVEWGLGHRALYHLLGDSVTKHVRGLMDGISSRGVYHSYESLAKKGDAAGAEGFLGGEFLQNRDVFIVTAGSVAGGRGDSGFRMVEGHKIHESHAYAVIDYNPHTRVITLSNPHDSARHFQLSIDSFNKHFAQLSYVKINPLAKEVRDLENLSSPQFIRDRLRSLASRHNVHELFNARNDQELADGWNALIDSTRNPAVKDGLLSEIAPQVEQVLSANHK